MDMDLAGLGTRPVFNKTLRHLVSVTGIIEEIGKGQNAATLLNGLLEAGTLNRDQVLPILSVALVHKYNFPCRSINLSESFTNFGPVQSRCAEWTNLDLVLCYMHPNLGTMLVNPSVASDWEAVMELKRDELITLYARSRDGNADVARRGMDAFFALLAGKDPGSTEGFKATAAAPPPPPPPPPPVAASKASPAAGSAPATGGKRMISPKYSVQVTNELFHNGNVEAWKNVIEAYETTHHGCKIIVYHEGELIQDLNSLFKWGKVKHGGLIFFQAAGPEIKHISRLQKYLFEAASNRFEAFLKKDVNRVLSLF
ncbi:MAG: hypothetical protein HS115_09895 [Spirochaetales bacterium]|nr:hypothetical protein [Spirochaetales bacterium]